MTMNALLRMTKEHDAQFEKNVHITKAHTVSIDVSGSCTVAGREGYKWVREYGVGGGVFQCVGIAIPDRIDLPVLIGYEPKPPYRRIILGVDWSWVVNLPDWASGGDGGLPGDPFLPNHHLTHEWPDYAPGPDVVNVYPRAMTPLRTYAGTAGDGLYPGLSISVAPYTYELEQDDVRTIIRYPGESNIDISHLQPSAGLAVMVLVYLDIASDTIVVAAGAPVADVPALVPQPPTIPSNVVLSALVRLDGAATAIAETDITDVRQLWNVTVSDTGQLYNLYFNTTNNIYITNTLYVTNNIYTLGGYPYNVITVDAVDQDADFDNVADAVAAAESGAVIAIGPGQYVCDNVTLPDGVALIGMGFGGTGAAKTVLYTDQSTALILGDGCHVQSVYVESITAGTNNKTIVITGSDVVLYDAYVFASGGAAEAIAVLTTAGTLSLIDVYLQTRDTVRGLPLSVLGDGFRTVKMQGGMAHHNDDFIGYDLYAPHGDPVHIIDVHLVTGDVLGAAISGHGVYGNDADALSHIWIAGDNRAEMFGDLRFQLAQGIDIYAFSDDGTFAGNTDNVVPTEKAVRTYVRGWTDQRAPHIANTLNYIMSLPGLASMWAGATTTSNTLNNLVPGLGIDLAASGGAYVSHYAGRVPTLEFDGIDDNFNFFDAFPLDFSGTESIIHPSNRGLTIFTWARIYSTPAAARIFVAKSAATPTGRAYQMYVDASQFPVASISSTGSSTTAFAVSNVAMTKNVWSLVAMRFRPSHSLSVWNNLARVTSTTSIPASIFNSTASFRLGANDGGAYLYGSMSLPTICMSWLPDNTIENIYNYSVPLFI